MVKAALIILLQWHLPSAGIYVGSKCVGSKKNWQAKGSDRHLTNCDCLLGLVDKLHFKIKMHDKHISKDGLKSDE